MTITKVDECGNRDKVMMVEFQPLFAETHDCVRGGFNHLFRIAEVNIMISESKGDCKLNKCGNIDEIIRDMKAGVYDFTQNGKCSSCGQCCSNFLPLSSKDIKRIKAYIEKNHIKAQTHRYPFSTEVLDLVCPFRSEAEQKCLIYDVRPMICRDFRCDKPKKNIQADKALYQQKYYVYDVRDLFYGV